MEVFEMWVTRTYAHGNFAININLLKLILQMRKLKTFMLFLFKKI